MHTEPRFAALLILLLALPSLRAGDLFTKQRKAMPEEEVGQLTVAVRTDSKDSKREEAARHLRDFDGKEHPEIVPVLIDVVRNDTKTDVRIEAIKSLAKIRPVSRVVASALEEATHDASLRVRLSARNALLGYRVAGLWTGKADEPAPVAKQVPQPAARPLAQSKPGPQPVAKSSARQSSKRSGAESSPPPLAVPPLLPRTPLAASSMPPAKVENHSTATAPAKLVEEAGPDLGALPPKKVDTSKQAEGPNL